MPVMIAAGAVLAAVAAWGAAQRQAGRRDAAAEAATDALHNAEVRHEIEDAVRRTGGAAKRLRDVWSRD
ncbi:hypothetical protein D3093_15160 (plasmid) [Azospirillum argentinense]|uniref:Uncharacterized protein n=2 Tax=Azospirillum argentinense TaxID=2970906 RepID=A0A4D8PHR8_9PROT|nr:hypothetical protein D3093_15160 [Azospirillum argentinense]